MHCPSIQCVDGANAEVRPPSHALFFAFMVFIAFFMAFIAVFPVVAFMAFLSFAALFGAASGDDVATGLSFKLLAV